MNARFRQPGSAKSVIAEPWTSIRLNPTNGLVVSALLLLMRG